VTTPIETLTAAPDEMAVPIRALHFSEVYVIWRPYTACKQCRQQIETGEIQLPSDGDYTCRHVQKNEYKETMDKCLAGKGAFMLREHFNLMDGSRVAHIEWCEIDPEFVKEQKAKEKEALKNSIAPTFGVGDVGKE